MKVMRFKNNQPEWNTPLRELAPVMKQALRMQWREFIHEIQDAEELDNECSSENLATNTMFERLYKAS
jgi:hypothetical protein